MKTEITWTTLLASLFLSYTNAAIIVLKENQLSSPYYDSHDSSTLTTGWRISADPDYFSAYNVVSIQHMSFHTDSDCRNGSQVDLSDANFTSSHGDANYAFDNNASTSWDTKDFLWSSIYNSYYWDIQYDNGPEESVQCIRIDLDVSPEITKRELETTIYMIEGLVTSEWSPGNKSWKTLFRAAGLIPGTNILDLNIICQEEARDWRDGYCDSGYNTKNCEYDGGDCEDQGKFVADGSGSIIGLLPVVISILGFIALYRFFKKQTSANTIAQTPPNNGNIPTSPSAPISDDQREIRRERILTNIIHKKALSKSTECHGISDTGDHNDGEVGYNTILVLPHEESISLRLAKNKSKASVNDEEEGVVDTTKKDNIFVESLRSMMRENSLRVMVTKVTEDSLYSPRSCPICCENYQKGDEIAWSKNEDCHHAYHVDCILEWLMEHEDCPMCREKYVSL